MKKTLLLIPVLLCCLPALVQAQNNCSVSGSVQDSAQRPIDLATVALRSLPDSAIVKTTLSDSAGTFLVGGLKEGSYFIEVFAMDHAIYQSTAIALSATDPVKRIAPILLRRSANKSLGEVEVTARKALVVHKADRTVVNVDALLSASGGTALDVLAKSPGVQVDQNDAISLRGKQGVTIYINDRPTYMSGTDLANYLKSLPASALDQVELMTNPPANYDAAGNAGIINIKLKRNNVRGFNGTLNLSVNQGQLTRSNNSLNLNYRKNKISAYTNVSYGLQNSFTDLDLNRTYKNPDNTPKTYFEQKSYFRRGGNSVNAVAGVDYYHSEKTTIGMILTGMGTVSKVVNDNTSSLYDAAHDLDSTIVARNRDDIRSMNGSVNLNYRRNFKKEGHNLTVDADYLTFHTRTKQVYRNTGYLPPRVFQSEDTLKGRLPSDIDIYTVKLDHNLPIKKWMLGMGVKTAFTSTDNLADYTIANEDTSRPDYGKSNHFLYKENINAAYVNLNREFKSLSLQLGLRMENTISDGHQLGNPIKPDSSFKRNYTNLFPTLFASYRFDTQSKHQMSLRAGRRIDRPYYQDMNPFLFPMDKFTYYTGNPYLKPSFVNIAELSYTYRNSISASFSYSQSIDNVSETIRIQDGIYYSMSGNLGSKTTATLAVDADFNPTKWLNIHTYGEAGNITTKSNFYTGTLNTSGDYGFIMATVRASAGKGWDAEVGGNYRSRLTDAQFVMMDLWGANFTVQKKVNKKINFRLGMNDIFYTQKIRGYIGSLNQAEASWINRRDTRSVSLSFTYRFGKNFETRGKYEATGAETEKNRVKS